MAFTHLTWHRALKLYERSPVQETASPEQYFVRRGLDRFSARQTSLLRFVAEFQPVGAVYDRPLF